MASPIYPVLPNENKISYPEPMLHHQKQNIHTNQNFGPFPIRTTCCFCGAEVETNTFTNNGLLVWLLSGCLCIMGCVVGCCLIPFCINATKDIIHKCPNCNKSLGYYKRL